MYATILLVDPDTKVHQTLIPDILAEAYELFSAFSRKQVLEIVDQHATDLLLTEIILPDTSGFSFLNQAQSVTDIVVYTEKIKKICYCVPLKKG